MAANRHVWPGTGDVFLHRNANGDWISLHIDAMGASGKKSQNVLWIKIEDARMITKSGPENEELQFPVRASCYTMAERCIVPAKDRCTFVELIRRALALIDDPSVPPKPGCTPLTSVAPNDPRFSTFPRPPSAYVE